MGTTSGPHTRNSRPGIAYRGSHRRVNKLSPFDGLPVDFWVFISVALAMLAVSGVIVYRAIE
jgi:hypothetical protein